MHSRTLSISIHAPLTGCDLPWLQMILTFTNFNPRTPYGMRPIALFRQFVPVLFQSTHPLRDATVEFVKVENDYKISIHAPLTGCDLISKNMKQRKVISIHAPLTGCDPVGHVIVPTVHDFNPRTPYGMRQFMLLN